MIYSKIEIALRSKAFWSLVSIFLIQGLTAILPQLHGSIATIAQLILGMVTLYQHPNEVKIAGQTGRIGSAVISKY